MSTLFVSDLHLDPARPEITALFLRFLQREAASADALYILGDLFEAWVGDDDPSSTGQQVADGLRRLADAAPVYACMGNHDGGRWSYCGGYPSSEPVRRWLEEQSPPRRRFVDERCMSDDKRGWWSPFLLQS